MAGGRLRAGGCGQFRKPTRQENLPGSMLWSGWRTVRTVPVGAGCGENSAPSRTRTYDLLLRRQLLYPTELWAHKQNRQPPNRQRDAAGFAAGLA